MLESKGILSIENIDALSESITNSQEVTSDASILFATHIAASCLVELEEYEDCVCLLDPLLSKSDLIYSLPNEKIDEIRGKLDVSLLSGASNTFSTLKYFFYLLLLYI